MSAEQTAPLFRDGAEAAGLVFAHDNGMTGEFYLPEIVGPGGGFLDYDRDGDLDVLLIQGRPIGPDGPLAAGHRARLFRNDLAVGNGDERVLRFTDVTDASGLLAAGYGMGMATGDYDNDGWIDVYVTNWGPNQLFRNNGDGTFQDVTARSGTGDPLWGTSAAFVDYDRDGNLDLVVANYVQFSTRQNTKCYARSSARDYCGPQVFEPSPNRLYRNRGDGTFADVTVASGLNRSFGAGLGVVAADFDRDGWNDLYVANDGLPNQLWMNQQDGTFVDRALLAGAAYNEHGQAQAGMGVDAADFDGDGDEDILVTNLTGETNALYVNDGSGLFEDRNAAVRLAMPSFPYTGFGMGWIDYDNDGWLDLIVMNGAVRVIEALARLGDPYPLVEPNQMFRNIGGTHFEDTSAAAGAAFSLREVSRGAALGDVDNDGDMDVLQTNNRGPCRLLLNRPGSRNNWVGLRFLTAKGRRDALGAQVEIRLPGGRSLRRRVRTDGSYLSANDPRVLVGLGDATGPVTVRVQWPGGAREEWPDVGSRRYTVLVEGTGRRPSAEK